MLVSVSRDQLPGEDDVSGCILSTWLVNSSLLQRRLCTVHSEGENSGWCGT